MAQRMRGGGATKGRAPRQARRRGGGGGQVVQGSEWSYWPQWGQDALWWGNLGLPAPNATPWPASGTAETAALAVGPQGGGGGAGGGTGRAEGTSGTEPDAAGLTESLLDALAPGAQPPPAASPAGGALGALAGGAAVVGPGLGKAASKRSSWLVAAARPLTDANNGLLAPENLLGHWVDSQGNAVHVLSTDAYDVRLEATLSRPPRADIHLSVKPVMLGAGWQCGHSLLDPVWTSPSQLHWVAMDGRVSVWVRPQEGAQDFELGYEDELAEEAEQAATAPKTVGEPAEAVAAAEAAEAAGAKASAEAKADAGQQA